MKGAGRYSFKEFYWKFCFGGCNCCATLSAVKMYIILQPFADLHSVNRSSSSLSPGLDLIISCCCVFWPTQVKRLKPSQRFQVTFLFLSAWLLVKDYSCFSMNFRAFLCSPCPAWGVWIQSVGWNIGQTPWEQPSVCQGIDSGLRQTKKICFGGRRSLPLRCEGSSGCTS